MNTIKYTALNNFDEQLNAMINNKRKKAEGIEKELEVEEKLYECLYKNNLASEIKDYINEKNKLIAYEKINSLIQMENKCSLFVDFMSNYKDETFKLRDYHDVFSNLFVKIEQESQDIIYDFLDFINFLEYVDN